MVRQMLLRGKKENKYFDYSLVLIVVVLVAIGLVMIYSTSAYASQVNNDGDSYYYLKKQAFVAVLGFAGMFVISNIPYQWWRKIIMPAYLGTILLLGSVYVFGIASHGQKRWIQLGPLSFQPSEMAKAVLILFLAAYASKNRKALATRAGIIKAFAFVAVLLIPVTITNLSTGMVILGMSFVVIFIASREYKFFAFIVGLGICFLVLFLNLASYRMDRIEAWLNVETSDAAFQTRQALYAIGSGGIFGKGLGHSIQKLSYVPEAHNDMIFSIICEELGLFGAFAIILLFVLVLIRCMYIAMNASDLYGSLIVIGVMAQIGIQVIINIGVVTNTLPNTGIPLPFISYGGTSIIFLLCEIGLVLSVSRGIVLKQ